MVRRFIWLLLVLVIGVVGTLVFLRPGDTQDVDMTRTIFGEDRDRYPGSTNGKQSALSSDAESDQLSEFQHRESVDGTTASKAPTGTVDQAQPLGFHEIALSEVEKANLLHAPSVFLSDSPSEVLTKAMELGRVELVRADRDFDENEYVTQGWIYYEPLDGQVPVVLCLSQTKTIIDWMYCQEETRPQSP